MCRFGLRGLFLLNIAWFDLFYGVTLAFGTPEQIRNPRFEVITGLVPGLDEQAHLWLWAGAWWLVAVLALVYAFRDNDDPAYGAALAIKVVWASLTLIGFLEGQAPDGISFVGVWMAFAVAVGLFSRVSEPGRRRRR
jgi:hypothetical protein